MALRWLLESPEESLGNTAKVHRQELLSRFPKYAETAQKVRQLQADLAQATTAAKPESQRELAAKFGELASLSATQEAVLHEMAVSREPAEILFPPIRKAKDVQDNLAPGHILLTFYTTNHGTYAWMYSKEKSQQWKINNPALLDRRIVAPVASRGQCRRFTRIDRIATGRRRAGSKLRTTCRTRCCKDRKSPLATIRPK